MTDRPMDAEMVLDLLTSGAVDVPLNPHLASDEPTLTLENMRALVGAGRLGAALTGEQSDYFANAGEIGDGLIERVHAIGGEAALFRLNMLMMKSEASEYRHFGGYLRDMLPFAEQAAGRPPRPLDPDNAALPAGPEIARIAHNVINPNLSRKLFNPGRAHGYLVYGLVRPRILVSLPFKGVSEYTYDVFSNSLDVATSLNLRGYYGTFLMFDCMPGLNRDMDGLPAWLVFFALIAANADLVVFISEGDGGLTEAQQHEARLTPDRVPKKIVTLTEKELRWAKADGATPGMEVWYVGPDGQMTEEEWFAMEASHAMPLVEAYLDTGYPDDRLFILNGPHLTEIWPDGARAERTL